MILVYKEQKVLLVYKVKLDLMVQLVLQVVLVFREKRVLKVILASKG